MPFEKLNAFTKKVQDLADKPNATMTASEVKAQFDAAPDELRVYLNNVIEVLQSVVEGDSGADNVAVTPITGITGASVQSVLETLKVLGDESKAYLLSQIQGITLGQIPDGTITDVKLSEGPTDIKTRFNEHSADEVKHITAQERTSWDGKQAALPVENRRKITFGTAEPTGGVDGDVYFQYE